jgi:hypothetical protein
MSSSLVPDLVSAMASGLSAYNNSKEESKEDSGGTRRTVTPNVAEDAKRLANEADEFIQNNDNKQLIQYALMAVGAIVAIKTLVQSIMTVLCLIFPLLYVYMVQTCPQESSFDGKKELRRVLRGHHLPEDHPDKPKGYFTKMAAKVSASVQTQVTGCQQEMTSYKGAFIIVSMKVPSAKMQCYWIGALGGWKYIYSSELSTSESKKN